MRKEVKDAFRVIAILGTAVALSSGDNGRQTVQIISKVGPSITGPNKPECSAETSLHPLYANEVSTCVFTGDSSPHSK